MEIELSTPDDEIRFPKIVKVIREATEDGHSYWTSNR